MLTTRMLVRALTGMALIAGAIPTWAGSGPETPGLDAAIAGARHGQALAAARICPGAKMTTVAEGLAARYQGSEAELFREESEKVVAAWAKAFSCTDVDPAQTREINGCRRAKILSCNSAWQEIGPDGTALPGLLAFGPVENPDSAGAPTTGD